MTLRADTKRLVTVRVALSLSTIVAAGLLAGCTSGPHPSRLAAGAEAAAVAGKADKGVSLAEQAVLADPRNPAYRTLLGNAYLRAGRFESARQAFDESMQLGEDSGKAALSLALADIALGRFDTAADTLEAYRAAIPASDYGLAMAMSGRTVQGVSVLVGAIRAGDNSPKMRQNLAFAYALAGQWREARVMAAQDLSADQLDARMQQWLLTAGPRETRARVATLLGAPVRADAGQPQALALANFPDATGARQADATPNTPAAPAPEVAPQLAQAAAQELPALPSGESAKATPAAAPAPTIADASRTPSMLLAAIDAPQPRPAYRVVGANVAHKPSVIARAPLSGGTHLVQLGAFSTSEGAQRAWRHFVAKNPALGAHKPVIAQVTVNGRQFWRVQAAGFQGYARASALCGSVKAKGGSCLVMASAARSGPAPMSETRFARRR